MLNNLKYKIKEKIITNNTVNDVRSLIEAVEEYSSYDRQLEETDFRSILYITPPEQKQLAFDMIESMVLYTIRQSRAMGRDCDRVLVLCPDNKKSYWYDKFKEFPEVLQVFDNFNILAMSLLNYAPDNNLYTVIFDQDLSDLVCYEGMSTLQAVLYLPFVDSKFSFLSWCSDNNIEILTTMLWDMFTCKLAFRDSLQVPIIAQLFGTGNGVLEEPTDFKMCSGNRISALGLKQPLHEQYCQSKLPLGE